MEVTNGKSQSFATCNVTIQLGQIPAISIVRKKNAPEKIHPFKQFVVRGKFDYYVTNLAKENYMKDQS